jgi:hypothetical protein
VLEEIETPLGFSKTVGYAEQKMSHYLAKDGRAYLG